MSWRDQILREFQPEVARLTLVADPDGLLLEEGVLRGLQERGFELIPFDDPIAFRYVYELRYRSCWDRGESTELVVVLRSAASDVRAVPYDLLHAGRVLTFDLAQLFPNLNRPVIDALDRKDLDALYEAQARRRIERPLGRRETEAFVLRHVFKIAPETIHTETDLLKVLLERHYKAVRIPAVLDDHFIRGLRSNPTFRDWPLKAIVPDRNKFFRFLQERWPIFLDRLSEKKEAGHEQRATYGLDVPGPEELPFDHADVRVYLDNLFHEGLLVPVPRSNGTILEASWASVGIALDPERDLHRRWDGLLDTAVSTLPEEHASHGDWRAFALRWAHLVALRHRPESSLGDQDVERFDALRSDLDEAFLRWLTARFGTLHNQPPSPPVMLHHVARHVARSSAQHGGRVALVVVDGLSLDQWIVVREALEKLDLDVDMREDAVFAWVPTLTPVSRQACFAGTPPHYFPRSIGSTTGESRLWRRFWEREGLAEDEAGYEKAIRSSNDLKRVEDLVDRSRIRVVGLVVDQVDRIMHGMTLGTAGMHNQVRQWMKGGCLADLITLLLEGEFTVFLTSDHGNVEARGIGRPSEGSVADVRGQRARVFPDPTLRARVEERFPGSVAWSPTGLPEEYFPLLASGRTAFVPQGEIIVAHGGACLEEVVVPFVEMHAR